MLHAILYPKTIIFALLHDIETTAVRSGIVYVGRKIAPNLLDGVKWIMAVSQYVR
jgi:hypothetical protein